MFEMEGYEWTKKNISLGISMYNPSIEMYCGKAFKDGAEFGYNKCFEQIRKIVNEHTRLDCIIPELLRLQEIE